MGKFYRLHYSSLLCIKCPTPLHTICIACVHGTARCSRKSTTVGSLCAQHARVLHKHKQISAVIPIYISDTQHQHVPKCKQCNTAASHQFDGDYVCAAHAEYCALCKCALHHSSYRLDMPLCSVCQITKCRHIGCILPSIQELSYCAAHHPICDDTTCGYRAICVIGRQKLCIKHTPTCATCSAKIKIRGVQIAQNYYCNTCGVPPCIVCSSAAIYEKTNTTLQKTVFVCELHHIACIYPGCMQTSTFEYCEQHENNMQRIMGCVRRSLALQRNLRWISNFCQIAGMNRQIKCELYVFYYVDASERADGSAIGDGFFADAIDESDRGVFGRA